MGLRDTIQIAEVLQVIWKRLWLIVLGTVLVSIAVFVVSMNLKPIYRAKTTVMVRQPTNAPLSIRSLSMGEDLALTYSKLLKTRPILEIVIANLNLDISPDDLVEDMLGTRLIPDTELLELTVEDTDAQRASDIANEIASTFISLHNTEQQLHEIVTLEQDVVAQMTRLRELIEHNQSAIDRPPISSDLFTEERANRAQTILSTQQNAYASLLATYLSIQLTQGQLFNVTVVEPAIAPTEPVRPKILLYTLVGAFLGLNLSVGLAFLLEHLESSFQTTDDVRQVLSLPALGTIPRLPDRGRDNGLVTLTLPHVAVSEAYRTLRTNIRFADVDEPLTTLLITSAEPGAGKTTVVANLGIVCAQAGLQVVLIDADLRLPSLHRLYDLDNHAGLTDLLVGNVQDVKECEVRTGIDNLHLITSGPVPPNPSELLGSKRMSAVLAEVQRSADFVILDTPPTLAVADAAVLARQVDGVLLVLDAGRTRQEAARRAVENLRQVGANLVGVVLNGVPTRRGGYYYYEYSGDGSGRREHRSRRWREPLAAVRRLLTRRPKAD